MKRQRIVVKIGSSSLTNDNGEIDQVKFNDHVDALAMLKNIGHEVIVVSSGAVAAGFARLGYSSRPQTIKGKQAAAAVGQSLLIQSYIERFSVHNVIPAQILLTRHDFADRDRYRNAFAAMSELLDRGIMPIINENDTVSIDELTFGDNDMLSALVSGFLHADQLIILTDVNGIYTSNPRTDPDAVRLTKLDEVTDELLGGADDTGSKVGTGGMRSKLLAARTAHTLAVPVFIGTGRGPSKLLDILKGHGDGTYISSPVAHTINTNRQWIALHSESTGRLYVDKGAEEAIVHNGRSLLPAGVFKVQGNFEVGEVVEVFGLNGLIGKGEVTYSSEQLKLTISDKDKLEEFKPMLEVIHRDRWVQV
ncbi:glutamate 5-kinase [Sporosarcina sp. P20a]|uniref:glutamate 5-kinase n=1 Tax=unclassified Sporosarcina TaxID=2647733 RepID=UPI000C16994C|nr:MULTISPECIES: glutamate 5-kinase [unclassified Sporosarcina]PIC87849.1 glutamate 5-kinase [Sporosarcina sp. P20a]PID05797.1 glutamate 5-kinase [Sporosarcina sp. P30]PID08991.1 glutamate 5-kinase [Sporosarcina sp. P31]PID12077.1 glutamate 5-kinase [Sporosarcina sp. P32b]